MFFFHDLILCKNRLIKLCITLFIFKYLMRILICIIIYIPITKNICFYTTIINFLIHKKRFSIDLPFVVMNFRHDFIYILIGPFKLMLLC